MTCLAIAAAMGAFLPCTSDTKVANTQDEDRPPRPPTASEEEHARTIEAIRAATRERRAANFARQKKAR